MAFDECGGSCAWCQSSVLMRRSRPPHGTMLFLTLAVIAICGPFSCIGGAFVLAIVLPLIGLLWALVAVVGGGPWLCTRCGRRWGTHPPAAYLAAQAQARAQAHAQTQAQPQAQAQALPRVDQTADPHAGPHADPHTDQDAARRAADDVHLATLLPEYVAPHAPPHGPASWSAPGGSVWGSVRWGRLVLAIIFAAALVVALVAYGTGVDLRRATSLQELWRVMNQTSTAPPP